MTFNIESLFAMQKELDERIEDQHQLHQENTTEKRILALQVELGELANETRCFKFWSLKPPAEKSVILEEYVDGLHFILSLGLVYDYRPDGRSQNDHDEDLTKAFLTMFETVSAFYRQPSQEQYNAMFFSYRHLGDLLHFSEEDIVKAYGDKNDKNHTRQDNGY